MLLAKNDRTMVAPKLPPVTSRATSTTTATAAAKKPAPAKPAATTTTTTPAATPDNDELRASVRGPLDKEAIRTVIRRHLPEIASCYEQALLEDAKLDGRFFVRMKLVTSDGAGHVSEAEIVPVDDGYLDSPSMQSCVLQAVSRWQFPPSIDGSPVLVDYPFQFRARDGQ